MNVKPRTSRPGQRPGLVLMALALVALAGGACAQTAIDIGVFQKFVSGAWVDIDSGSNSQGSAPELLHDVQQIEIDRSGTTRDVAVFRWGDTRRVVISLVMPAPTTMDQATLRLVGPDGDPFTFQLPVDPANPGTQWDPAANPDEYSDPVSYREERPRIWIPTTSIVGSGTDTLVLTFDIRIVPSPGYRWNSGSSNQGLSCAWDATARLDKWDTVGSRGHIIKDRDGDGLPDDIMGPNWDPTTPDGVLDGWDLPLCERDRYWEPGLWTLEGVDYWDDTNSVLDRVDFVHPDNTVDITAGTNESDYFIVAHPLNLEFWEVRAPGAAPRRYSFYSHGATILDEQDMIYDSTDAVPAAPRERVSSTAESALATENYTLANGNRNFMTREPADPASRYSGNTFYRDFFYGYDYTDLTDRAWLNDDLNRGLGLPVLDLWGRSHGSVARFVAEIGASRDLFPGSGLYVENASHIDFARLDDQGGGLIKVEPAPLLPMSRVVANGPNGRLRYGVMDYWGRPVPNFGYPPIPAKNVRVTSGGTDLVRGGINLPWIGGQDASPITDPASADYRKLDVEAVQGANVPRLLEDGQLDGPMDEARLEVCVEIPRYQPALVPPEVSSAGTNQFFYWTEVPVEDTSDASDPRAILSYLADELPNGDLGSPRVIEPVLDYRKGWAADYAEDEAYMMKVYIDLNGNGQLDLPDTTAYAAAWDAESASDYAERLSYGYLMAEPYRCFSVRLRIDPDPERVELTSTAIDFGNLSHDGAMANGEPIGFSPRVKVGLRNETNRPLGIDGLTPGVGFTTTHFMGETAELGVVLPSDRVCPDYDLQWRGTDYLDPDPNPELWAIERAQAGASTGNSRTFLDFTLLGYVQYPLLFKYDEGEEAGYVRLFTAPLTPMGAFAALGRAFADSNGDDFYTVGDALSDSAAPVKVRISEAPLPPRYGQGGLLYDPEVPVPIAASPPWVDPLPPQSQIDRTNTANINTNWADADPAVYVNLSTSGSGVANGVPMPDYGAGFGTLEIVWSSNRPDAAPVGDPNWSLWQATLTPDVTDPTRPRLEPGDAVLYLGDPSGMVPPPSASATLISWSHFAPSFDEVGEVLAWATTVEWADPATQQIIQRSYLGWATRANNFTDITFHSLGDHRIEGVRPYGVAIGDPTADGVHFFYYGGPAGTQQVYHVAALGTGEFGGPVLVPLGEQVYPRTGAPGNNPRRMAGTEHAAEPWVGSDYYWPLGGGTVQSVMGMMFTGRSVGKGDDDIFYARLDLANGFDKLPFRPTDHNGAPRIFAEQWTDPVSTDVWPVDILEPLPEGRLAQETGLAGAQHTLFRSRHIDWYWEHSTSPNPTFPLDVDEDNDIATAPVTRDVPWITIRVQEWDTTNSEWIDVDRDFDGDGTNDGPMVFNDFAEDPGSGLLFATNAQGVRVIEVDPAGGVVRFLEAVANAPGAGLSTIPEGMWRVAATYVPQALRMTQNYVDDMQPGGALTFPRLGPNAATDPTETIFVPEPYISAGGTPGTIVDFYRPERLMLTCQQRTPDGATALVYQTFSTPLHPDDGTAWDARDRTWMFDADDDLGGYPASAQYVYRDSGPVAVPVERGVLESHAVIPVAIPHVYGTYNLLNFAGDVQVPYVDYDASSPVMVLGPTVFALFYTSAGAVSPVDPGGGNIVTFDPDGPGGGSAYHQRPAGDLDLYYGVVSPRTIPSETAYLNPSAMSELQ